MYRLDEFDVKVHVNLDNGLYRFENQSSTGKTWLCKTLKQYRTAGAQVAGYTYADKVAGLPVRSIFYKDTKLVVVDRCTLYSEEVTEELLKHCKDTIILVDIKDLSQELAQLCDVCFIEIYPNKIVVYDENSEVWD